MYVFRAYLSMYRSIYLFADVVPTTLPGDSLSNVEGKNLSMCVHVYTYICIYAYIYIYLCLYGVPVVREHLERSKRAVRERPWIATHCLPTLQQYPQGGPGLLGTSQYGGLFPPSQKTNPSLQAESIERFLKLKTLLCSSIPREVLKRFFFLGRLHTLGFPASQSIEKSFEHLFAGRTAPYLGLSTITKCGDVPNKPICRSRIYRDREVL